MPIDPLDASYKTESRNNRTGSNSGTHTQVDKGTASTGYVSGLNEGPENGTPGAPPFGTQFISISEGYGIFGVGSGVVPEGEKGYAFPIESIGIPTAGRGDIFSNSNLTYFGFVLTNDTVTLDGEEYRVMEVVQSFPNVDWSDTEGQIDADDRSEQVFSFFAAWATGLPSPPAENGDGIVAIIRKRWPAQNTSLRHHELSEHIGNVLGRGARMEEGSIGGLSLNITEGLWFTRSSSQSTDAAFSERRYPEQNPALMSYLFATGDGNFEPVTGFLFPLNDEIKTDMYAPDLGAGPVVTPVSDGYYTASLVMEEIVTQGGQRQVIGQVQYPSLIDAFVGSWADPRFQLIEMKYAGVGKLGLVIAKKGATSQPDVKTKPTDFIKMERDIFGMGWSVVGLPPMLSDHLFTRDTVTGTVVNFPQGGSSTTFASFGGLTTPGGGSFQVCEDRVISGFTVGFDSDSDIDIAGADTATFELGYWAPDLKHTDANFTPYLDGGDPLKNAVIVWDSSASPSPASMVELSIPVTAGTQLGLRCVEDGVIKPTNGDASVSVCFLVPIVAT